MPHPSHLRGYVSSPPTLEDAADVVAVIAAAQQADLGAPEMTLEELTSDWHGLNLAEEAILLRTGEGVPVAFADVLNRRNLIFSVYGYVDPAHRGRGLGTALVRWGEQFARDRMTSAPDGYAVLVQHYVPGGNQTAPPLLTAMGYLPVRQVFVMTRALDEIVPAPPIPDGMAIRQFQPGFDDRATFETVEDAFRDHWSRPPSTFARFQTMTNAPGFDPGLWLLATVGSEIVGAALGRDLPDEAWIDTVAVRRDWRRQGVGFALLVSLFHQLRGRGIGRVALSVDSESPTGAPRLYARAGMVVRERYTVFRKHLREGTDPSMLDSGD